MCRGIIFFPLRRGGAGGNQIQVPSNYQLTKNNYLAAFLFHLKLPETLFFHIRVKISPFHYQSAETTHP